MAHYVKVFDSIIHSTIWQEGLHIKVVWVTMLAMADPYGSVQASVPGLAKAAGVTLTQCEDALALLLAPDPYSRSKEADGRRIEVISGGWELINYNRYRKLKSIEQERELSAERSMRYRSRHAERHAASRIVTVRHGSSQQEEEDVKEEEKKEKEKKEKETSLRSEKKVAGVAGPEKQNKKSQRYTSKGFSDRAVDLAFVIKDSIAPKFEPGGDHRTITCDMSPLCQRLEHIMGLDPAWDEPLLIRAYQDYLHDRTEFIKAPQNFFSMTPLAAGGDPPWLPYAKGVLTQNLRGVLTQNSRERPLPSSEGHSGYPCLPITVSDNARPGSCELLGVHDDP